MTTAPYHNKESFARAIERLLRRADSEGRGDDIARVVSHLSATPEQMTRLGSFMILLDEDWRVLIRDEVEAFRRWGRQRSTEFSDEEIMRRMLQVYEAYRQKQRAEQER